MLFQVFKKLTRCTLSPQKVKVLTFYAIIAGSTFINQYLTDLLGSSFVAFSSYRYSLVITYGIKKKKMSSKK